MAGRPRKDNQLKKLQGTYRKDRDKDLLELTSMKEIPHHPDSLNERGQQEWYRVVSLLHDQERLPAVDLSMIEAYCIEVQNYFEAIQQPRTQKIKNGYVQVTAWHTVAKDSLKNMKELANLFGITPAGRTKLPPVESKKDNPLDELRRGNETK